MVRNGRFLLTTAILALLGAAAASATPVAITNFSFEADALADNAFTTGTITGWTCTGSCGVFNPPNSAFNPDNPLNAPAQGVNVAWSNSGSISQAVGLNVVGGGVYTLRVAVGNRADAPFPGYQVQLLAGSTVVAQDNSLLAVPDNTFQDSVVTFAAPTSGAVLGQALSIRLISNGLQTDFDNVRLDTTVPEPGTLSMMLLGFGAVVAGIRRKIRA